MRGLESEVRGREHDGEIQGDIHAEGDEADPHGRAGILSRERLRAAQAYQRSMKVQLSTAIVTLGLASPQRIEWAAVAHQSQLAQLARERGY